MVDSFGLSSKDKGDVDSFDVLLQCLNYKLPSSGILQIKCKLLNSCNTFLKYIFYKQDMKIY